MDKVIIIVGPTGIGKSKLAVQLAKHYDTEIINGDAFQTYKHLDIGTAKITKKEMQKVKHHLLDINDPKEEFSVAKYQKMVRRLIEKFNHKHKTPILVGGSGLYIDSVIRDYRFTDNARDENVEIKYANSTNEEIHAILAKLDYETSLEIHPNNRKRVLRAIEMVLHDSSSIEKKLAEHILYDACILYLNTARNVLYKRINERVNQMMESGLLREAKHLFDAEVFTQATKAIGYKELFSYFKEEITLAEAIDKIKQNSRNYAKRQLTWFRNKTKGTVLEVDFERPDELVTSAIQLIDQHFKK
jgi:tRNA dimethylallyltransferase